MLCLLESYFRQFEKWGLIPPPDCPRLSQNETKHLIGNKFSGAVTGGGAAAQPARRGVIGFSGATPDSFAGPTFSNRPKGVAEPSPMLERIKKVLCTWYQVSLKILDT